MKKPNKINNNIKFWLRNSVEVIYRVHCTNTSEDFSLHFFYDLQNSLPLYSSVLGWVHIVYSDSLAGTCTVQRSVRYCTVQGYVRYCTQGLLGSCRLEQGIAGRCHYSQGTSSAAGTSRHKYNSLADSFLSKNYDIFFCYYFMKSLDTF